MSVSDLRSLKWGDVVITPKSKLRKKKKKSMIKGWYGTSAHP